MKKITLFIFLLTVSFGFTQNIPVTFSNGITVDSWKADSGLTSATVVVDPVTSTGQVGKMVSSITGADWQNAQITFQTGFNKINLTGATKTITFKYYSNEPTGGLLKIENGNPSQNLELPFSYSTANVWETIVVNFTTANAQYNKIVFFPHLGSGGAKNSTKISYIDDVTAVIGDLISPPITSLNVDFQTATTFAAFDGAEYTDLVDNDVTTGINTSSKVGQIAKVNNMLYSNLQYNVSQGIDLSSGDKGFSLMVKGPRALPVKLKLEGGTQKEVDANYTTPGVWQKLTFDFSTDTSTNHNLIVLFFNIEGAPSATASDDVFKIDNLILGKFSLLSNKKFSETFSAQAYPNPTQDSWTIKTKNIKISSISVFDILGKNVLSLSPNSSEAKINASNLKSGLYFAKINTENGSSSLKLVKK